MCAFHLYGWACEHEPVATQAAEVRSGRLPDDYPSEWPDGKSPDLLSPGTAPFTDTIRRAIAARKAKIRADLQNTDYLHYPKREVEEVLKFWMIDLG
ncbi:hypothetical protein AAFX91_18340 [Bradyrhizobium sp. 31Argb]|uniref:hypothetical protein n=1 Tax=Bradyrhizobium sp. 31Argb TaxID=3141247 RepID=UPI00374825E5